MRDDIMDTLCTLLVHLGSEFVIFLPLLGAHSQIEKLNTHILGCGLFFHFFCTRNVES